MVSEEHWKQAIRDSLCFIMLATESYFKDVKSFEQSLYAKKLGKPFIVALKDNVKIPDKYPIPVDAVIFIWKNNDELCNGIKQELTKLRILREKTL